MMTVTETYSFNVRETPASSNAGGGGYKSQHYHAAKEKKRWEGLFLAELMLLKPDPFMVFCSASIRVCFPRRNHRDEENYRQPVIKPLADALQKGGYLRDDTEEWFAVKSFKLVEGVKPWPYPTQIVLPSGRKRYLIDSYLHIELEAHYQ